MWTILSIVTVFVEALKSKRTMAWLLCEREWSDVPELREYDTSVANCPGLMG